MRTSVAVGMSVVIALGLSACASTNKRASLPTTPAKATSGPCGSAPKPASAAKFTPVVADTLSVVARLPSPGYWEFSDADPTRLDEGLEYDLARCLESEFGLHRLSVRNVSVDAIVAGAVTKYDLALSQITIEPERAKAVSFSSVYFDADQSVLMRSGDSMRTLVEAKNAKWGVQAGVTPASDLLKKIGATRAHLYPSLSEASAALQTKQIDAILADTAINFGLAGLSKGALHIVAQIHQPNGPGQYRAVLPKGSANLAAVDAVFKTLRESGELKKLVYRDLGADPGPVPVLQAGSS